MALGGRHQPGTVDCEPGIAHYSGTPQGRGPREIGPHGCTLVQIDETGHVQNQFIATDTVRWLEETVEITASTRSEELEKRLETSLEKLQARHSGVALSLSVSNDQSDVWTDERKRRQSETIRCRKSWILFHRNR